MFRPKVNPEEVEGMLQLVTARILDIREHPKKHTHKTPEGSEDLEGLEKCCTLSGNVDPYLLAAHRLLREDLFAETVFKNGVSSNGGGL